MTVTITVQVNGGEHTVEVEPRLLLADWLREHLGLTGTHLGCEQGACGACTILLNGAPVRSCLIFAVQADGQSVTTVEGLARDDTLHPVQAGFWQEHGLQCGFCTPGFLTTATALMERENPPSRAEIREALSGNLCRCTGYQNIVNAVEQAFLLRGASPTEKR